MTTSLRLENEHLGSAHFDAIREQDEAQALEDVRQKERELQIEAAHAFDDLLDHSASSDTSSYYKPPTSNYEGKDLRDEEIEDLRSDRIRLVTELNSLRKDFEQLTKQKTILEEELQKAQTRVSLLEQENGELSDAQTIHRVKDQYELVIEKLKAGHKQEKLEILQQLNKYREESQLAKNQISANQELIEKKTKLELELQNLHSTVAKLQQKELDLQLKIKEQSILLHEQEPTNRSLTNCADVLIKMCRLAELSIDDLLDDPNTEIYRQKLNSCYDKWCSLKDSLTQKTFELEQTKKKCDELRLCASTLEKENHLLKEKFEHSNSDTESQSDTARLSQLKAVQVARDAAEQLESKNLQLKLQIQTLEEQKAKMQLELNNLFNNDAKHRSDINELLNERRQLVTECQRAREAAAEAHRENEMNKEIFENEKEVLRKQADTAANEKFQEEMRRLKSQMLQEKEAVKETITSQLRAECVRQLQERLNKIEQEKQDELERVVEAERNVARNKVDELHERVIVLTEEIEELRREQQSVLQEKKEACEKLRKSQEDLDEANYQLTHRDDQISRLKSHVEDMRLESEARLGEVVELKKRIGSQQATLKKAKVLLVKANSEKQTAAESNIQLEKKNEALQKQLDTLSDNLNTAENRCSQLQAAVDKLRVSNEQMSGGSGDANMNEVCAKLTAQLEDYRRRLNEAEQQTAKIQATWRNKVAAVERARAQMTSIKEQGRKYDLERKELFKKIDKLENEISIQKQRENSMRVILEGVADKLIGKLTARQRLMR